MVSFLLLPFSLTCQPPLIINHKEMELLYSETEVRDIVGGAKLQFANKEYFPGTPFANKDDFLQVLSAVQCGQARADSQLDFGSLFFSFSRLLYLAYSANLGLLCMPLPGMGPLV